jgi:hypothetical protein
MCGIAGNGVDLINIFLFTGNKTNSKPYDAYNDKPADNCVTNSIDHYKDFTKRLTPCPFKKKQFIPFMLSAACIVYSTLCHL